MLTVRLLLFIISIFIIFIPATGEKLKAQGLGIGVTAGFNSSSHLNNFRFVADDINLDFTPNFNSGFNGGLIIRREINPGFRFQAEPSVILLGASYQENFTLRGFNIQSESKTELIYAHLPLVVQWSTVPPERTVYGRQFPVTTFHVTGGLFGGYLIDARFTGTNTGAPIGIAFQGDFTNNVTNQYTRHDAGVLIGAGFEHGVEHRVGVETRLLFSAINSGNAQFDFSPHNMAMTVALYYLF